MKKTIIALLFALTVGVLAIPAFAADTTDPNGDSWLQQRLSWMEQRINLKKDYVDQQVKDGNLTAEQGQAWKEHLDSMYKFHQENGFLCPGGGPGMQGGRMMGNGFGRGAGAGAGFGMGSGYNAAQNL